MSGKDAHLQRVRADFSQLEGVLLIFIIASNTRLTISCHVTVYVTEFGLCVDVRKKMRQVVTYLAFLVILAPAAVAFFIPPACVSFPKIGCGWPPCPLCPCVQIKPTFGLCQQCARPHMIALACCENMPVAMNDVIIPKTAVVATITTNSRKFILSILYYHKTYNIYEVL